VDSHIEKASIKAPVKIQKAEPTKKVAPVPKEAAYSVPEENGGFVSSSQKTAKNVEKKIEKKQTLKDPKQVQKELAAGFAALSPAPSRRRSRCIVGGSILVNRDLALDPALRRR